MDKVVMEDMVDTVTTMVVDVEAAVVVCEVDVVVDVVDHTEVTKVETSNKVMVVMEEAKVAMVVVMHKAMATKEGMVDNLKGMVTKEDTVNRETKVDMVKETKVDTTKETKEDTVNRETKVDMVKETKV